MPNDFTFDLARNNTFASLSASDLEGLGKRASQMYLAANVPLSEAVIKLAQGHPGISQEQVRRVVEFANTETFQRLFEKQAGDKNVEFKIADPGEVLRAMDFAARPAYVKVAAAEYAQDPEKLARSSKDLQADLALMQMFGVEPSSEALSKLAEPGAPDMTDSSQFLQQMPPGDAALQKGIEYAMAEKSRGDQIGNYDALSSVLDAVKNTAETMSTQPNPKEMLKAQEGAMKQQAKGMAGGEGGGGGGAGDAQAQAAGAPMPAQASGPVEMNPPGPGGALTPPDMPNTQGMKIAELVKQAEAYTRLGRPDSGLVLDDLRLATSLEHIKTATKDVGGYPEANPFGELIRTKQQLEKMAEDAFYAKSKNEELFKEASSEFAHHVRQDLLGGGNLGAIAHAMSAAGSPEQVKLALEQAIPTLIEKGFDLGKLQADSIAYEMEKGAASRVVNAANPIIQSFGALTKLAEGQPVLDAAATEVLELLKEADGVLGQAMKRVGGALQKFSPGMMKAEKAIARSGAEASHLRPVTKLMPGAEPPVTIRRAIAGPQRAAPVVGPHPNVTGAERTVARGPTMPAFDPEAAARAHLIEEPMLPSAQRAAEGTVAQRPAAMPAATQQTAQQTAVVPQRGNLGRRLKQIGVAGAIGAPLGMGAAGFAQGFGAQGDEGGQA